jgi:FtsZ-binding cell division protein ZapB
MNYKKEDGFRINEPETLQKIIELRDLKIQQLEARFENNYVLPKFDNHKRCNCAVCRYVRGLEELLGKTEYHKYSKLLETIEGDYELANIEELEELGCENYQLRDEVKELKDKIEDLQEENGTLKQTIESNQDKIDELECTIAGLEKLLSNAVNVKFLNEEQLEKIFHGYWLKRVGITDEFDRVYMDRGFIDTVQYEGLHVKEFNKFIAAILALAIPETKTLNREELDSILGKLIEAVYLKKLIDPAREEAITAILALSITEIDEDNIVTVLMKNSKSCGVDAACMRIYERDYEILASEIVKAIKEG